MEVPVARTPAKVTDTATTDGAASMHDSAIGRSAPAEAVESTTEAHVRGARVKLPKITLPRFNGDPVRWTSFWDSYQSAIYLNSELTEVAVST